MGQAFGVGLIENLEDGYSYLMENYQEGDKLFLFGFSQGAFTARTLAGIIARFGILERGNKNLVPYVMKMYSERYYETKPDVVDGFARDFCTIPDIHCIGVWDTVASLGYYYGKEFPNNRLSPKVKNGFHAIAIDEKRKKFPVSLWDEKSLAAGQAIEQVWFPGVHSDVGGWYDERDLSDIAFAWMMDKASSVGLRLRDKWNENLNQKADGTIHESRTNMWKAWRPVDREIPTKALVHQSVIDRVNGRDDYDVVLPEDHTVVQSQSYKPPKPG